jgi:hypothetical protein
MSTSTKIGADGTVIDIETDESLDEIYRGISRKRLQLYPGAKGVLDELRPTYRMSSRF